MKQKTYDAILLLGLKLNEDGSPTDELIGRTALAAKKMQQGAAPFIVLCGGQTPHTPCSEASVMGRLLLDMQIPQAKLIYEGQSQVTYENIRNAQNILQYRKTHKGKTRVLVITSDYHVLRAVYMARSMGFHADGCGYQTPKDALKRTREKKEVFYFLNFAMGWETGKHKRPSWYDKAVTRIR